MTQKLQRFAFNTANIFGRNSALIRTLRPVYERALNWSSAGCGIPWEINGATYRIDARHRHQLGNNYDAPVAEFLRTRLKPGALCFDVGANVGVYVLQFARWSAPDGQVVAFEPNPEARRVLARHVWMNGLQDRVELVSSAIGGVPGEAVLYAAGTDGMSRLSVPNWQLNHSAIPITVSVTTLDDFCAATGIAPDWLLIDIEGFEIAALRGATRVIAERREKLHMIVEMHPDVWSSANTDRAGAEALLTELKLRPVPLTGQTDPLGEHGLVYLERA